MKLKKLKTKIHFNRINMQRNDPRVWSAHNSLGCHMSEIIQIIHDGHIVMETVFKPEANQPRAYMLVKGNVSHKDGITIVEV